MHAANHKRRRGQHLRQRRVFLVHPHIQLLQIAHARPDVRHFINGDGLASRRPARKQSHKGKKQNRCGWNNSC